MAREGRLRSRMLLAAVGVAALAGLTGARAAEPAPSSRLAGELSALRAEVESLAGAIERDKDDRRVRLRGLADQVSQLEIELRREVLRKDELTRRTAEARARVEAMAARSAGIEPVLRTALGLVREAIARSLPYRLDERLGALDALTARLDDKTSTPSQVLGRLWELVESELRLGRESALDRQVVRLASGEERLAQVVRIGMATLYYRAGERECGQVVREGERWVLRPFATEVEGELVTALFESFEKRVRTGFFVLPWLDHGGAP